MYTQLLERPEQLTVQDASGHGFRDRVVADDPGTQVRRVCVMKNRTGTLTGMLWG